MAALFIILLILAFSPAAVWALRGGGLPWAVGAVYARAVVGLTSRNWALYEIFRPQRAASRIVPPGFLRTINTVGYESSFAEEHRQERASESAGGCLRRKHCWAGAWFHRGRLRVTGVVICAVS